MNVTNSPGLAFIDLGRIVTKKLPPPPLLVPQEPLPAPVPLLLVGFVLVLLLGRTVVVIG